MAQNSSDSMSMQGIIQGYNVTIHPYRKRRSCEGIENGEWSQSENLTLFIIHWLCKFQFVGVG